MTNNDHHHAPTSSNTAGLSWRRISARVLGLAGGAAIAGTVFAYSGVYNVGATEGHSSVVERVLRTTMANSVRKHASSIPVPERLNLSDRAYATKFSVTTMPPASRVMAPPVSVQIRGWYCIRLRRN